MTYTLARPTARELNPNYGKGNTYDLAAHPALAVEGVDLAERLRERFSRPDYDPPKLPSVALELMELSRRPDVPNRDLIAVLEKDSLLAGRVLKVANSAAYGGTNQVRSLNEALVRLGRDPLADLVMQIAMSMRVFRCKPYAGPMERLRLHSLATAHICRHLARQTALASEFAFLCGLLHDAGIAAILVDMAEHKGPDGPPKLGEIWPAIEAVHEEVTAQLCTLWGLPPEVSVVLANHHTPVLGGMPNPLACVIALSEAIATLLGYNLAFDDDQEVFGSPDVTSSKQLEAAQKALGFGPARMKALAEQARAIVEAKVPKAH